MPQEQKAEFNFMLGSDPEFSIINQSKMLAASNTLEYFYKSDKQFSYHDGDMGYRLREVGVIGFDGHDDTGELRPEPSKSPAVIANHIGKLIHSFTEKCGLFDISTLSEFEPLGGHIHFDVIRDDIREEVRNSRANSPRVNKLHKMMSAFYIPIMMSENKVNIKRRISNNYGSINDFRIERHGDDKLLYEFRVPTAEWITTSEIATATLAYLGAVYHELNVNWDKNSRFKDIFYRTKEQGNALQTLLLSDYDVFTEHLLKRIQKHVKSFEMYPKFKKEIDYILNPSKVMKDKEAAEYNMVLGWNVSLLKPPTKRSVLNKKEMERRALDKDLEMLVSLVQFPYNEDINVEHFVKDLQQRVIAFNWKLKNTYFLFGLRKGVPSPVVVNKNYEFLVGQELIKTTHDDECIRNLFDRMANRFGTNGMSTRKLDMETLRRKQIMIGIPYDMRIRIDTRPIVELVYDIERGAYKPNKVENLSTNFSESAIAQFFQDKEGESEGAQRPPNIYARNSDNMAFRQMEQSMAREEEEWGEDN